jgi:acetylornithine/succinyldiaminopimelate/putrescine aminotransferase
MDRLTDFNPDWMQQYVAGTYGRLPIWLERGQGSFLYDHHNQRYLDLAGGVAVSSLGHSHPELCQAISKQASTLMHVSNWYCIKSQAQLARLLVEEVVQIPGKCFFSNSGTEANEGMIKFARRYGITKPNVNGKPREQIITFQGSFHGRTFASMSATAQEKIHANFGSLLSGFTYAQYNDNADLISKINDQTVAIMLEPIQGESGVIPATPEFLSSVQQLAKQHDLLILLDDVQAGVGRLGHMASWHAIVDDTLFQPDLISWAKSMGAGFPIGAFWINARQAQLPDSLPLCDLLGPGSHGSTYGGNPLACTTSLNALNIILRDQLYLNAATQGQYLKTHILSLQSPFISDVRGLGLMLGVVLNPETFATSLEYQKSKLTPSIYFTKKAIDHGLLVVPAGADVVRILAPLNLSSSEAQLAISLFQKTLATLSNS